MRILIVEPNKEPFEMDIENDLESMQKIVGGYIEFYGIGNNMSIVCNEEGKLLGFEGNRRVGNEIIAGTFFIVGENEECETISLDDEQMKACKDKFRNPDEISIDEVEDSIRIEVRSFEEDYEDEYEL